MNRALALVIALVAGLAVVFMVQNQTAATDAVADAADAPEQPDDGSTDDDSSSDALDSLDPFAMIQGNTMAVAASDANCTAFLTTIQSSEGTLNQPDPYAVCYGYVHTVQDKTWHPAEWHDDGNGNRVREWGGEPLDNLGPSYVGLVSTAAGAYQIKLSTWLACKKACGLPDFSNASQDRAALYLVQGRGALDAVKAGQFDQAVALCAPEWASLPGANYAGQGMHSLSSLEAEFTQAGGAILS